MTVNASCIIRVASTPDISAINRLLRASKAHWGYEAQFMESFMLKFSVSEEYLKRNIVYVMEEENLIGFYTFVIHDERSLELDHFFIHPDFIGKGFGRKLWASSCLTAKNLGKDVFTLWADPNAELFYTKMGCKKIAMKKSPFLPNRMAPIMQFRFS